MASWASSSSSPRTPNVAAEEAEGLSYPGSECSYAASAASLQAARPPAAASSSDAAALDLDKVVEELERQNAELQAKLEAASASWERERSDLQARLEFVEEIVGPTEAQRKAFQLQLTAAREAALQARRHGAAVPVRFAGRLDEAWLRTRGLSERDCALLQRGCIAGQDSVPQDVSVLGDPGFRPYEEATLKPRWEARGGYLRLSLGDIRSRWGEEVALEVVRCAIELDRYDSSRRLGLEVPWHAAEGRELQPAEVIGLLERDLALRGALEEEPPSPTATTSPVASVIESVYSLVGGRLRTASVPGPSAGLPPGREELYEWSLADADIEQLLLREGTGAKRAGTRSPSSTGPLASPVNSSDEGDGEGLVSSALLELVDGEFAHSFGFDGSSASDFGTDSEL